MLTAAQYYQVVQARDARFDGLLFVGVSTTGVYCRPICTVRTPKPDRCNYFASAALAEAAGFRPCLRCRPELAPGSAPVDAPRRTANLAVARIEAGALSEGSMTQLARGLGVSVRQLHRVVESEYGVSPLALEQTRRLLLAKQLLTDTHLSVIDVAFASGFASLRQFNRQFREQYRLTPSALRKGERRRTEREPNVLLKLGFRAPFAFDELARFLVGRSGLGTEIFNENGYLRTVRLGRASGFIRARVLSSGLLGVEISSGLLRALPELRARLRRLFDLDADPLVIDRRLGKADELRRSVKRIPGLRVPGALSGFELALRTVLGQQISVKAATTIYGRFVDVFGGKLETPEPSVNRVSPDASDVANATLQQLIDRGLTRRRAESVHALAVAVADGELQLAPPADFAQVRAALAELPGIGPWTTEYILMRALGDPDAFPHSDLGLLQATGDASPAALLTRAEAFRPYRAYAALRLWHGASGG